MTTIATFKNEQSVSSNNVQFLTEQKKEFVSEMSTHSRLSEILPSGYPDGSVTEMVGGGLATFFSSGG